MPPAQSLHLAAQFEVTADSGIIQHAEAVDDGEGAAGPLDHLLRVEIAVCLVKSLGSGMTFGTP